MVGRSAPADDVIMELVNDKGSSRNISRAARWTIWCPHERGVAPGGDGHRWRGFVARGRAGGCDRVCDGKKPKSGV